MKASVIIPNLNGAGWLRDSIESIWAQTEQDFELIVIDNGSTDESLAIARNYCGRDRYTLIENADNTGFSHAVNQGIAIAKGRRLCDDFGLCLQARRWSAGQPLHKALPHFQRLRRRSALPQIHSGRDRRF